MGWRGVARGAGRRGGQEDRGVAVAVAVWIEVLVGKVRVMVMVVLWVNIDVALSRASVQIPIHGGGLSIGQARRADWLVGGLQAHAASIDALAGEGLGW